ncbi:MAG TPA: T9SS type A sorting domain-containing protein, partial [Flavobacterium sp.]|nr:T9SS type A sorting domain-containing protein [Flavobacterium sp.]
FYESENQIIGNTNSGFNNVDTYSFQLANNAEAIWTVEGGKIESGQGTNSITVKWGIESYGKIIVKEKNNNCLGAVKELIVNLNINSVPENVSIARIWNEALLDAIRKDFARPTVHARNLFHTAIALYDSWAIYDEKASPYLMGNTLNGYQSTLNSFTANESKEASVSKAMSYATYRLLTHRFKNSPGALKSLSRFDLIMNQLGYDVNITSIDYESGDAAALGNYIAQTIINYGLIDGSNEANSYANTFYKPINPPLDLDLAGQSLGILDCNHWQPLSFNTFIDQSGNIIPGSTPKFLSPEWGKVHPFALKDKKIVQRDGNEYTLYYQPELPPQLNIEEQTTSGDQYKWNFSLVSKWSSHLDVKDGVMWDISPNSIGNIPFESLPKSSTEYPNFYNDKEGGDIGKGYSLNPKTGQPYQPQMVLRGDYTRVLAEFWADGPESETPPGHWFTILNYVSDHPQFTKKFNGQGEELSTLEWNVKTYFILAGAVHDAAVTAWGIKGWADYIRPISAIRFMAELGQSTDENLPNYHVGGIKLEPDFIELVEENDPLSGENLENVGKIKVKAWIGHDAIQNAETDVAGAGWILAENWWPYQRPSFVTPPFAGFISGHSTFSRAAAEVMTLITGDEYFPGGMSEFKAPANEFLAFEKGPSQDITLQWATYRDASDQCSLSRIWGGIHPPADDIPGRIIGHKIGKDAYNFALPYFDSSVLSNITFQSEKEILMYPNPVVSGEIYIANTTSSDEIKLFDIQGRLINLEGKDYNMGTNTTKIKLSNATVTGMYLLRVNTMSKMIIVKN